MTISAGKDANIEGTQVRSKGDASINAGGDVNFTTARSTSAGVGVSLGAEAESKSNSGDPTQDSSSKGGSVGVQGGYSSTHEGASVKSDGKLSIASGGKATLVNTTTKGKEGTSIDAAGGVSRTTVSDSELTVKVSAAGTSVKSAEAPAPAADANVPAGKETEGAQPEADEAKSEAEMPAEKSGENAAENAAKKADTTTPESAKKEPATECAAKR